MGKGLSESVAQRLETSQTPSYNNLNQDNGMSVKPVIHFAHANGVPSMVYQKLFDQLKDEYDIIYVPLIGPDKRYPITDHWPFLVDQVIDSIVRQAKGRKVIGLGIRWVQF
jgi:hypothetical protein